MQRSSIIATVVAAGGVLIAGSVASVAVINAASSSEATSETVALAQPQPDAPQEAAVTFAAPAAPSVVPEVEATPLPSLSEEPLPALPKVEDVSSTRTSSAGQKQSAGTKAPAPKATKKASAPKASKSARPSPSASATQQQVEVREISEGKATSIVRNATDGGEALSAQKTTRGGYDAWAIQVLRKDGSVITGYVDRASGVVFDWVVNKEAPAPTATSHSGSSGDDDHEDDHHEDDHDDD